MLEQDKPLDNHQVGGMILEEGDDMHPEDKLQDEHRILEEDRRRQAEELHMQAGGRHIQAEVRHREVEQRKQAESHRQAEQRGQGNRGQYLALECRRVGLPFGVNG